MPKERAPLPNFRSKMPEYYDYPIWNGKKIIGYFRWSNRLFGVSVVIPVNSILKQKYGKNIETISVPLVRRVLNDDGVRYTVETALDVRRKSERQIKILMQRGDIL